MRECPPDLTVAQHRVLEYIVAHLEVNHCTPTCAEISKHFKWASPSAAHAHIRALQNKGWLGQTAHGRARGYRLPRHKVNVRAA